MAAKDTTVIVKVTDVERLRNSTMGNPRWEITGKVAAQYHDSFVTMSDASDSYSITESTLIGETVELTLTPAGRVRYFKIIKEGA